MKSKNPLYVVKGKQVEAAANWFDLFVKKFELEPVVAFLQQMINMLLAQVQTYPLFLVAKSLIDQLLVKLMPLLQILSGLTAAKA